MDSKTICFGVGCKIRTKCGRYGLYANAKGKSYMAACKEKIGFVGKKPFKKIY